MQENLLVKRTDLFHVPFTKVKVTTEENIRRRYPREDLVDLAEDIKENGVLLNLSGWKQKEEGVEVYYAGDGFRRYFACELLYKEQGIEISMPFRLKDKKEFNIEQRTLLMLSTGANSKPLDPVEQAEGIGRLLNWGSTPAKLAKKLGKSTTYINNMKLLYSAPERLKDMVYDKVISATLLIEHLNKGTADLILQEYQNGNHKEETLPQNENLVLHISEPSKPQRITKKDLQQVNSWKNFKKYSKEYSPELVIIPEKKLFYDFMQQILNNELTEEQIANFFENETV